MIRRNSSRKKQRRLLTRSKSMNCVISHAVPQFVKINPEIARRDAYIAATLSFGREDPGSSSFTGSPKRENTVPVHHHRSNEHGPSFQFDGAIPKRPEELDVPANMQLQRQQSVRFAGPNAEPKKQLGTRAENKSSRISGEAMKRQREESQSDGEIARHVDYPLRSYATTYINSTKSLQMKTNIEPSAQFMTQRVKRLRKSRSMFSALNNTPSLYNQERSFDRLEDWLVPSRNTSNQPETQERAGISASNLRAPKSMSFLRPRLTPSDSSSSFHISSRPSHAVHSRLGLHRDTGEYKSATHSSIFLRGRHKRTQNYLGLPQSLRNSSNSTDIVSSSFSATTASLAKATGIRYTARKVSKSFKSKLRSIFRLHKSDSSVHGDMFVPDSDRDSLCHTDGSILEEASVSRVRSHIPSVHSISSDKCPHSRQGSVDSIEIDTPHHESDRSRVTSWTNSSTCTGANSHILNVDLERQRLSVINETDSQASARLPPYAQYDCSRPSQSSLDNKIVYSALVRRLDEMNKKQQQSPDCNGVRKLTTKEAVNQDGNWSPHTIRCVRDDDDVFRDGKSQSKLNFNKEYQAGSNSTGKVQQRRVSQTLSSRSSVFFASPSNHLFRTQSPYRRALQQSMKAQPAEEASPTAHSRYLSSLSTLILPTRNPSPVGSERDVRITSAESIYSCDSESARLSGLTTGDIGNTEGHAGSPVWRKLGEARIYLEPTVSPKVSSSRQREVSSASSVEWKTWLSANVSKLETPPSTAKSTARGYASTLLPIVGHIRETTEIDSSFESQQTETPSTAIIETTRNRSQSIKSVESPLRLVTTCTSGANDSAEFISDENYNPASIKQKMVHNESSTMAAPPLRTPLRSTTSLPNVKAQVNDRLTKTPQMSSPAILSRANTGQKNSHSLTSRILASVQSTTATSSAKSSPGLTAAVERQFGAASITIPITSAQLESDAGIEKDISLMALANNRHSLDAQVMGSKRMVDLFLSSRRNRPNIVVANETSTSRNTAFI